MISIQDAKKLLFKNVVKTGGEKLVLQKAFKRILSEDILAPISHPIFDQTAVDGYALQYEDINADTLEVIDEIKAGGHSNLILPKGKAARIFTGAPIPEGADTVVMQEVVERKGGFINITPDGLKKGDHIRKKGEQIQKGDIALAKGTELTPAGIGFIASLGIQSVKVACLPDVNIVVTGSEFAENNTSPKDGNIYESNGIMLGMALGGLGIQAKYQRCVDNLQKLESVLKETLTKSNVIIITGGVSVGDYDFTGEALKELGFDIIFHKVAQKPGKPILFAKKENQFAFGLPGNPRSALVCFYEYVYPFLRMMTACVNPYPLKLQLPLTHDYKKKNERTHLLTGECREHGIKILDQQGSHMLQSFAKADALVLLPGNKNNFLKGELVEVHLLPKT